MKLPMISVDNESRAKIIGITSPWPTTIDYELQI